MKKSAFFIGLFLCVMVFQINAQTETRMFSGSVGENRVQMTLERNGDALSGTYFYQKIGKDLKLSGAVNKDGTFTLTEKSPTGAKTGDFKGNWNNTEDDDAITLNGEWKNPQGTKTFEFYLTEQMIFFTGGAKITPQFFTESNKPKIFSIAAEYPEISGVSPPVAAKFNQTAKSKVMTEVGKFKKDFLAQTAEDLKFFKESGIENTVEISYNITYADNEIVSVWFGNYFYTGGAHPNSYSFTLNFDLKTGRELKLDELFKPNSNYLKVISDYCIQKLKEHFEEDADADWIETGAGATAENYRSWNITRKGLEINFDSYQVAPYVAGPQEVVVPYDKIRNVFGTDYSVFKAGK